MRGRRSTAFGHAGAMGMPRRPRSDPLTGPLNYYRASPLRPATATDPGAVAVTLPREMLEVPRPTHVLWALDDTALPPGLLDGLEDFVPDLHLTRLPGATHWVVHEQPQQVSAWLAGALASRP